MTQITITGDTQLRDRLRSAGINALPTLGKALFFEANRVMGEAKHIVPLDTGVLAGSGTVLPPKYSVGNVEVTLGFGGAAAAYALVQHENESYQHPNGREDHYLSKPLAQTEETLPVAIHAAVQALFGGL